MKITKISAFLLISVLFTYLPLPGMATKKKGQAKKTVRAKKVESQITEQQPKQEIDTVRQNLEESTKTAAKVITDATVAKNELRKEAALGIKSQAEAAKKIAVLDNVVAKAKRDLLAKAEKAAVVADKKDKEQSYLNQFMTGAYNVGADVVGRFRAGYGYSDQEKSLAQAVIDELQARRKIEKDLQVIKALDDEIYQQQLITGAQMATEKKLLLGAIGAAALLAGASYFGVPSDTTIDGSYPGEVVPAEIVPVVESTVVPEVVPAAAPGKNYELVPASLPVPESLVVSTPPAETEPEKADEQQPSNWSWAKEKLFGPSTPTKPADSGEMPEVLSSNISDKEPEYQAPPYTVEFSDSPSTLTKNVGAVGSVVVIGGGHCLLKSWHRPDLGKQDLGKLLLWIKRKTHLMMLRPL